MKLEPSDVPNVIVDLHLFCNEYPNWKIPMRYINILAGVLSEMLRHHPAVVNDVLNAPVSVALPQKEKK